MSELTPCNYCSFARMQLVAKREGMRITKRAAWHGQFAKGVDIFVHPPNLRIPQDRKDPTFILYHKAWFAELGDRCAC